VKDRHYAMAWVVGLIGVVLVGLGAWYWWTYLSPGAILRAVEANDAGLVEALIHRGADLTVTDRDGRTPLHLAAARGYVDIVSMLLDAGVDVDQRLRSGETPLHWAARSGMAQSAALLISRGAQVNAVCRMGFTPLHWAAWGPSREGKADVVRILLRNGADPNVRAPWGQEATITPLELALNGGNCAVAEALLEEDETEWSPVLLASAASCGCVTVMKHFIEEGADVKQRFSDGGTPLLWACCGGRLAAVGLLLDEGADVNAADSEGRTPLMEAADRGHADVVRILLERGASPAATDKDGWTALDLVLDRRERIEALLRKQGALTGAELRAR